VVIFSATPNVGTAHSVIRVLNHTGLTITWKFEVGYWQALHRALAAASFLKFFSMDYTNLVVRKCKVHAWNFIFGHVARGAS